MKPNENVILLTFKRTLRTVFYPQVLLCFLGPIFISIFLWTFIIFIFWKQVFSFISAQMGTLFLKYATQLFSYFPSAVELFFNSYQQHISFFIFFTIVAALLLPLIMMTISIVSSIVASTYLIRFVGQKEFPDLEKKGQSRFLKSIFNVVVASIIFLMGWVCLLPFLFFPPVWAFLSVALTGWYNLKISRFDILTEWCDDQEFKTLNVFNSGKSFIISLIASSTILMPMALFFTGILVNIALTHYFLDHIQRNRKNIE